MDRRQNNGSVKAVSPRHCPATSDTAHLLFQLPCLGSHKDNVRCTAVEELYLPLVEFTYLVFTRMPGESYRRRLRSLLSCLC